MLSHTVPPLDHSDDFAAQIEFRIQSIHTRPRVRGYGGGTGRCFSHGFWVAMAPESIHQPHDKLFKAAVSNPETAAAFLRQHLPRALGNTFEWAALECHPGSFIDAQLRGSEADLVLRVKAENDEMFLSSCGSTRAAPSRSWRCGFCPV